MLVDVNLKVFGPPYAINGVTYSASIEQTYTDVQLSAIGLYRVIDPGWPTDPNIKVASSMPVKQPDGSITMVYHTTAVTGTVPETITSRQLIQQLATQGLITWAEALAFQSNGTIPAIFEKAFSQLPNDQNQQDQARYVFISSTTFDRHNPETTQLQALLGQTDAQMDAIWVAASKIK